MDFSGAAYKRRKEERKGSAGAVSEVRPKAQLISIGMQNQSYSQELLRLKDPLIDPHMRAPPRLSVPKPGHYGRKSTIGFCRNRVVGKFLYSPRDFLENLLLYWKKKMDVVRSPQSYPY